AIDSTFIWRSGRLLPVSMTPTPSIMMFVSPPPPIREGSPVVVTPGANEASAVKLRFAIGRFSTVLVGIVNERSPLCDCTMGDSALTTTVSVNPPTSIAIEPTDKRSPGLTATPDRFDVLNPCMLTCNVYRSAGTLTNVNSPFSLVNTSDSCVPRVSLTSVTAAPGITAPCASLTVPKTVPVVIWAAAGSAESASAASIAIPLNAVLTILHFPPGSWGNTYTGGVRLAANLWLQALC